MKRLMRAFDHHIAGAGLSDGDSVTVRECKEALEHVIDMMGATPRPLKVMISGPMSGVPDFNHPLFNAVATELEQQGFEVYNPATLPDGWSHAHYMSVTLQWVDEVDALYMLDGWEYSKGASMEFDRILRGRIPLFHFQTLAAFRAALTRSKALSASLVRCPAVMEDHRHA